MIPTRIYSYVGSPETNYTNTQFQNTNAQTKKPSVGMHTNIYRPGPNPRPPVQSDRCTEELTIY